MEAVACQMGPCVGAAAEPDAAACPERSRRGACTVLDADGSGDADGISDVLSPYTFTGRRLDVESDLMQYRHRYYHSGLGRFVARDAASGLESHSLYLHALERLKALALAEQAMGEGTELGRPSLETIQDMQREGESYYRAR